MQHRTSPTTTVPTVVRVESCAHFSCSQPATDASRGMPLCRDHFFWALQLEQRRVTS